MALEPKHVDWLNKNSAMAGGSGVSAPAPGNPAGAAAPSAPSNGDASTAPAASPDAAQPVNATAAPPPSGYVFSPFATGPAPAATPLYDVTDPLGTKAAAQKVVQDVGAAEAWINKYLSDHHLKPDIMSETGESVQVDSKSCNFDDFVKATLAAGAKSDLTADAKAFVNEARVRKAASRVLYKARPHAPDITGKRDTSEPQDVSVYLIYTFTPTTVHTPVGGGKDTADQPAQSIAAQATFEYHGPNESGLEVSVFGQATWFADEKGGHLQNQSGFTGAQVAWVWSFLDGNLQAGPIFQAMVGAARAQVKDRIDWAPTGQVAAGGQLQFAVPMTKGHLMVGIQALVSGTDSKGADPTTDRTYGFTLTYKF